MDHLRLLELRNKAGLSQSDLAKSLNISRQAYSLYEINKRQMNYETLCIVADFFEVSTDYLLGRQEAIPSFLSDDERAIIEDYRSLDEHAKDSVKNTLAFERSRNAKSGVVKKPAM